MSQPNPQPPELSWSDSCDHERQTFADFNLASFPNLWELEQQVPVGVELESMRRHLHRRDGTVLRQTVRLLIRRSEYFLKRATGGGYPCLVNEYLAVTRVAEFGLTPPRLVAWSFDAVGQRGLLLFKRLPGYDSLRDLMEFHAPPEVVAEFQTRKKDFLKRLTRIVRRVHHAGYFYPDWHDKHIFVRRGGKEIMVIDLERLRHRRECPWYYRLPLVGMVIRRREWRTLRRGLHSERYTPRYLLKLLER